VLHRQIEERRLNIISDISELHHTVVDQLVAYQQRIESQRERIEERTEHHACAGVRLNEIRREAAESTSESPERTIPVTTKPDAPMDGDQKRC
jgi:DNA repair ATPase RecN